MATKYFFHSYLMQKNLKISWNFRALYQNFFWGSFWLSFSAWYVTPCLMIILDCSIFQFVVGKFLSFLSFSYSSSSCWIFPQAVQLFQKPEFAEGPISESTELSPIFFVFVWFPELVQRVPMSKSNFWKSHVYDKPGWQKKLVMQLTYRIVVCFKCVKRTGNCSTVPFYSYIKIISWTS